MGYGVTMRTRSYRQLSAEERGTLSLGLAHGHSLRALARLLGRAPSTVSREVARNVTRGRPYRACTAQTQAAARVHQPRRPRKLLDPWLRQYARTSLTRGCSPDQIAGRLRHAYPGDMGKRLSTETIYAALYVRPAEHCAANCWRHSVRRARLVGFRRGGRIDGVKFPI
jgi:IS30 family transposase